MSAQPITSSGAPLVIPPSFRFAANARTTSDVRVHKSILPRRGAATYKQDDQITFIMPTDGFLDPATVALVADFNAIGATDKNTVVLSAPGAWTCLQGVETFIGSTQVEHIQNYSHYHSQLFVYNMNEKNEDKHIFSANGQRYPSHNNAYPNAAIPGTPSGEQIRIPLLTGLTAQSNYIPLTFMKNIGMMYRFTLASKDNALAYVGSAVTGYNLSNVRLEFDLVYPNADLFNAAESAWAAGQYVIDFNNVDYLEYPTRYDQQTDVIPMAVNASSLQSAFLTLRQSNTKSWDVFKNRRWLSPMTEASSGTTNTWQFTVNNTLFPESKVDYSDKKTGETYMHAAQAFRSLRSVPDQPESVFMDDRAAEHTYSPQVIASGAGTGVARASPYTDYRNGNVSSFVLGMRFDAFDPAESSMILSGPDTKSAAGNMSIEVKRTAFSRQLKLASNGDASPATLTSDLIYNSAWETNDPLTWQIFVNSKRRLALTPSSGATVIL